MRIEVISEDTEVFVNGCRVTRLVTAYDQEAGYVEMNLVGHARQNAEGQFVFSLVADNVRGNKPVVVKVNGFVRAYEFPHDRMHFLQDLATGQVRTVEK